MKLTQKMIKKQFKKQSRLLKSIFKEKRKIIPHHNSRHDSFYQISQRTLRDKRKYD
jgi:hypothetical protein